MNILIWHEESDANQAAKVKKAYPQGMQRALAAIFEGTEHKITFASQDEADNGLSQKVLDETDVLIYWAHRFHRDLDDAAAERIYNRVHEGMGAIFLHSSHPSKPFTKLMGRSGSLKWREDNKHERLYTVCPDHPIANGIPERFMLKKDEMYGEYFDIATPDDLIFLGWYPGGNLFRSGFTYNIGKGKVFYFQPGHETFPVYSNPIIKKIIFNAAMWMAGIELPKEKSFVSEECKWVAPYEMSINLFKKK